MSKEDTAVVKEITRVFAFEHWARFYFAVDREGKTFLEVPEEVMAEVRAQAPDLFPLLEKTNHQELTYETSCANVGAFVCELLDGVKYKPGLVQRMLDSKLYKVEMHLFAMWLKGHEDYLDANPQTLPGWLEMYANWKEMDQVKQFAQKLMSAPPAGEPSSGSVH